MQPIKGKWELTLIPVFLIIALVMICFLEGCKGDDNEKDINQPAVHKTTDKTQENDQPAKPDEPVKHEENPDVKNPDDNKNNDSDPTNTKNPAENSTKKSYYTGEVVICLSNNTFGWVLPCG